MYKKFYEQHRDKVNVWIGSLVLAILPILCAILRCAFDGKCLTDVYLPASTWNDELFYYKLTENVINFGYPQGYFGFNESHGQYLSFAAWSPVLLLFWVIWGVLFGWNLMSPILCNIAVLSLAMLGFGLLAKPTKRQVASIAVLYVLFVPVTRFSISCIPEAELLGLFILFLGVAISCQRLYRGKKIAVMFALVMLMTWMRPYLLLLILTPVYMWWRVHRNQEAKRSRVLVPAVSGVIFFVTILVYYLINHYLSAPYLVDLFYTDWIKSFFEQGFFGGVRYTFGKLYYSFVYILKLMYDSLRVSEGLMSAAGLYYTAFLILLFILCAWLVYVLVKKKYKENEDVFFLTIQMVLCMGGFFVADLLMYRLQEGGRHTLVYILGCVFLLPFIFRNIKINAVVVAGMAVCFIGFFVLRGNVPYEFALPYVSQEHEADLTALEEQLEANMELTGIAPSYDNTIVWTFWDIVDGGSVTVDFGAYYAVPKGFGINLCDGGYMDANLENIRCRYIGTVPGGDFERRCIEAGGELVGECDRLVVYDMKP